MAKKKKNTSYAEDYRRNEEIKMYGKLVSLRPSIVHKDKKTYTRKTKHKGGNDFLYFFS